MKKDNVKIIGGGLFPVEIELSDETPPPSQRDFNTIKKNKEQIEYLKTKIYERHPYMKILVSACILGQNCKYNGKNNKNPLVITFLKDKQIIPICPEILVGMKTPRPCAEIVNGIVMDENGNNVHSEYTNAVALALSQIENEDIDFAILQSRSPTCGVNQIYDGSFRGRLISGMGLFAKALCQKGYKIIDVETLSNELAKTSSTFE